MGALTHVQDVPLVTQRRKQIKRKSGLPVNSTVLTPTETLKQVYRCGINSLPPGFYWMLSPFWKTRLILLPAPLYLDGDCQGRGFFSSSRWMLKAGGLLLKGDWVGGGGGGHCMR